MSESISDRVEHPTPSAIATAIGSMISDGSYAPGEKLPTVRAVATELGVSANTVSDAWKILQHHGVISTDRRRGTTVRSVRAGLGDRYWQVPVAPGTIELDLSTGTPDDELLPDLAPILQRVHADLTVSSYVDSPLLVDLEAELRRRWPFEPETMTVVDGAQDALDRTIRELVHLGDVAVVEDPTFPPLLDMLELAGARIIGVGLDAEGPDLTDLQTAMNSDPVAIFTQPRAHNPTGVHISRKRSLAIGRLVSGTKTVVVEDDHSAGAAGVPIESVGESQPDNVVHIHSFSKSHGPDLRIAAIGGPGRILDNIVRRRQLGPSWTSRLIQQILLEMLTDQDVEAKVEAAAAVYEQRRSELTSGLAKAGVDVGGSAGLNVWVPVADEQRAVVALAAQGIGVAPGGPFSASTEREQHVRVSLGALHGEIERVAELIAAAASPVPAQGPRL